MEILKNHILSGSGNKPILLDLYYTPNRSKKPLVIFCHGYKGYKDWGVFGKMQKRFTSEGLALLKFNFSHNGGTVKQPIDFPDLEAFGNNNYSKELHDLETVINWIYGNKGYHNEIDISNITLIGHSRGGGIVTLTAARDKRVKKLISWAAVSTLDRSFFHGDELKKWKNKGVIYIENGRTKQQMPHYIQFYEDYNKNWEELNIEKATRKISIPHAIIHGDDDLAVPFFHAKNLHQWNPKSELINIPNANHVFGAKQPWTEDNFPKDFDLVLDHTLSFILN